MKVHFISLALLSRHPLYACVCQSESVRVSSDDLDLAVVWAVAAVFDKRKAVDADVLLVILGEASALPDTVAAAAAAAVEAGRLYIPE